MAVAYLSSFLIAAALGLGTAGLRLWSLRSPPAGASPSLDLHRSVHLGILVFLLSLNLAWLWLAAGTAPTGVLTTLDRGRIIALALVPFAILAWPF